jgi:hypothetical protein
MAGVKFTPAIFVSLKPLPFPTIDRKNFLPAFHFAVIFHLHNQIVLLSERTHEMVLETLAAGLVKALATKAFEKVGEKTAESAWGKVKSLFTPEELITLNLTESGLQDTKTQGKIEGKLEDRLAANPEIAKELEALLAQVPTTANKQNTMMQIGTGNIGVQDVHSSTINIQK